jgi:Reverse transcriptase (RNA-dependent DNA polymerase)
MDPAADSAQHHGGQGSTEALDPKAPGPSATADEITQYRLLIHEYVNEWIESYKDLNVVTPELLWSDFVNDISATTIENLNDTRQKKLRDFLLQHGIYVRTGRGYAKNVAILACHAAEKCPLLSSQQTQLDNDTEGTGCQGRAEEVQVESTENHMSGDPAVDERSNAEHPHQTRSHAGSQTPATEPSGIQSWATSSRLPGLQGMMKAYGGRKKYTGAFDDDLCGVIEEYEMTARMCGLSMEEKRDGIVIMLEGPALAYYAANLKDAETYDKLIDGLKEWYTSEEQRARLLREWHGARLSLWMKNHPDKSEISVFRYLAAHLARIQRQLNRDYHKDVFLKDQLVAASDVPTVIRALREKPPSTTQEAQQRIAALLDDSPGSAGANFSETPDDNAYFGLGQRFKGKALRTFPGENGNRNGRSRKSIARIKGCWVCGKSHRAKEHHNSEEIETALQKHKASGAYVSAEHVVEIFSVDNGDGGGTESTDSGSDDGAHLAELIADINISLEQGLSNVSFYHVHGIGLDSIEKEMWSRSHGSAKEKLTFRGIIIDTGANRSSLMSLSQYRCYCHEFSVPASLRSSKKTFNGIGGRRESIGSTNIAIPFPLLGICAHVKFEVIDANVPSLLCLKDLREAGVDLSIQRNCLSLMGREQPLSVENGFLVHKWLAEDTSALFTEEELRKLHRGFGHPSAGVLYRLLKRARPEETSNEVKTALEELSKSCTSCAEHERRPRRFKLTVGADGLCFNSTVAVDVMYICQDPILHVVDEATHFASASWLKNMTTRETWNTFMRCWSHVYMGPPEFLRIDQGTNFVSQEFKSLARAADVGILETPVESPASMTHVERYHGPLRDAYEKLAAMLSQESKENLLAMAVSCVNNTTGPEGLCPTLCVFGAIPRPARVIPAPTQLARAKAIDAAMDSVEKYHAKAKIAFGLRYKGPFGRERHDLEKLSYGARVRVFREGTKRWDGPYKFVSIDGDTVCVELPIGRKLFRSNVVKNAEIEEPNAIPSNPSSEEVELMFGDCGYIVRTGDEETFALSRKRELDGLREQEVFEIVAREDVPVDTRIFGTRWIDTFKSLEDGSTLNKSRLVAQNYRDTSARDIPTKAPTISRMGERLALCLAAMHVGSDAYVRDITQAYLQASSELERAVFLKPPVEMELPENMVLRAIKPLYGIPESGLHWFLTYSDHHKTILHMRQSMVDKCLFYKRGNEGELPAVTTLQVDDSFGVGGKQFLIDEEKASAHFRTKPRKLIQIGKAVKFNGALVSRKGAGYYVLSQPDKLDRLATPCNDEDVISARAQMQYVASMSRPDLVSPSQLLAGDVRGPISTSTYKRVRELVVYCKETADIGLNFVNLDPTSLRLLLFADASFANADNFTSQLGFVIILADEAGNANIIHYGSQKSKRVTRSVLAAEILALVYGWDNAFVVSHALNEIFGRSIPVYAFVDSRTTFNVIAKHARTLEKRLAIDSHALQESLARGELSRLGWIPGTENPADALTRSTVLKTDHPLIHLMRSNKITPQPDGWAESHSIV